MFRILPDPKPTYPEVVLLELLPVFLFFGIIIFVVLFVFIAHQKKKKMLQSREKFARSVGLTYRDYVEGLGDEFPEIAIVNKGTWRKYLNVLQGTIEGAKITLSDLEYRTGRDQSERFHYLTICIVEFDDAMLPDCIVSRKPKFYDLPGQFFAFMDQFVSRSEKFDIYWDKDFAAAYRVSGEDRDQVYKAFNDKVRAAFKSISARNVNFEAKGRSLAIHYDKEVQGLELKHLLNDALKLFRAFSE